jgi:DNA-binding protein H-NS
MPAAIAAKMKQAQAQVATLPPEQRAVAEQMLAQQMPQLAQMMTQAAATAAPELFDATDAEAHAKPSSQYCAAPPGPAPTAPIVRYAVAWRDERTGRVP